MSEIEIREKLVKARESLDNVQEYRRLMGYAGVILEMDSRFIAQSSFDVERTLKEYIEVLDKQISDRRAV